MIEHRADWEADTFHLTVDQEWDGDTESLLRHLGEVNDGINHLAAWRAELQERLAARMVPGESLWVDDRLWRARRKKGKVAWDHDGIRSEVLRLSRDTDVRRIDESTGELESAEEAALRIVYEVAGVSYYRIGDLARHGLDADEWRATDPGPVEIVEDGP